MTNEKLLKEICVVEWTERVSKRAEFNTMDEAFLFIQGMTKKVREDVATLPHVHMEIILPRRKKGAMTHGEVLSNLRFTSKACRTSKK